MTKLDMRARNSYSELLDVIFLCLFYIKPEYSPSCLLYTSDAADE